MRKFNVFARIYCTRTAPFAPCVDERGQRILYPGYRSTTLSQRLILTIGSGLIAFSNPERGDMVAVFGETTGYYALHCMMNRMSQDPTGRKILKDKPRINSSSVDMEKLRELPDNTVGKHYITFMDKYGLSANNRAQVKYVDDTELAYIIQRHREVHDLIHVVNGMGIGLLGEITIKWFEAIQTGLPMCVLASMGSPINLSSELKKVFAYQMLPWIVPNAWNSKFYMNIYFEKHWEQSMDDFRLEFNLTAPPADAIQYTEPVHL